MATTYIDLTNRVLRRINEVETTQATFASVRGVQATAKDAVLDTIREINNSRIDWPFNAVEQTQVLVIGSQEYAWPVDFTSADFDSFQIQKDSTLNVNSKQLQPISREEWYHNFRDTDYDAGSVGTRVPDFVFPSHGNGWGVSPSPNALYTIKFRYYRSPDDVVLWNDQITIPSKYDYVITAGAMRFMHLLRENTDGFTAAQKAFTQGINDMTNTFLPNPTNAYGTQINFGGGLLGNGGFLFYKGGI